MFVAVVVTTLLVSVEVIVNGVAEAYAVDDDPLHTVNQTLTHAVNHTSNNTVNQTSASSDQGGTIEKLTG